LVGCQDGQPFIRHSPAVDDAIHALDAGDPATASDVLETYLSTGKCEKGELGAPESVHTKPNASFDLGIALFRVAERFGGKLGDDKKAPNPGQPDPTDKIREEVDCALRVVRVVASDSSAPVDLRAEAEYLTGNLEFLRGKYEDAVSAYDAAIKLSPGDPKEKDSIGGRAAWNRSIALRRLDDEQKKKPDSGSTNDHADGGSQGDGGNRPNESPDGGTPKQDDKKQDDKKDQSKNQDSQKDQKDDKSQASHDQKKDQGKKSADSKDQKQSGQQPKGQQPSLSQDERMLDVLEQAQTVQQENAKRNAKRVRVMGMEDK